MKKKPKIFRHQFEYIVDDSPSVLVDAKAIDSLEHRFMKIFIRFLNPVTKNVIYFPYNAEVFADIENQFLYLIANELEEKIAEGKE